MGILEKYRQSHFDLLEGRCLTSPYSEEMKCGAQSINHPTAKIEEPVMIGSHCRIGSGVQIKGSTVISLDCQILDGSTIERAVLWHNVRVGQRVILKGCIVGDSSLIGDDCHIPEGSVIGDSVEVIPGSKLQPGAAP